jgi:hypothetical protein
MDDVTRDHLRQLELALLDSAVRNRPVEVAAILADDFIEFGCSGRIFDKRQIIEAISGEPLVRRSVTEFRVRGLADVVALISYRVSRDDGNSSLRCSIWQRMSGEWRMLFHQGTPTEATGNA